MKSSAAAWLLSLLTWMTPGCGEEERAAPPPDPEADHSRALVLDGGRKWRMDEHTRSTLAAMNEAFSRSDGETLADLRALGAELDGQLDSLIRGCTMKGPAHDQLHVFLAEYIPAVAALKEAADPDAGRAQRDLVGSLLRHAGEFFE